MHLISAGLFLESCCCVHACVCVCVRERERERVCGERESVCVCFLDRDGSSGRISIDGNISDRLQ